MASRDLLNRKKSELYMYLVTEVNILYLNHQIHPQKPYDEQNFNLQDHKYF